MDSPLLSVIVPAYNEELRIVENVRQLLGQLTALGQPAELILVNDGSVDRTDVLLQSLKPEDPRLEVVSYKRNRGRGYALRQGFAAARGQVLVTTEADLSYGADIIQRLVCHLQQTGADVVVASPYMPGGGLEGVPLRRAFLSVAANRLLSHAIPGHIKTSTGMTRAYRRAVLESMLLSSDGKEIHLEILSKALALGFVVEEMPATLSWKGTPERRMRVGSFLPGKHIVSHLLFCFDERPFLLFGTLGLLLLLMGAVLGGYAFYLSWTGEAMAGRPMVMAATLFLLFGLQVITFSFFSNQSRDLKRQLVNLERIVLLQGGKRDARA